MSGERGQATVEYIGVLLLAATLLAGLIALVGHSPPGASAGKLILDRLLCAVGGPLPCGDSELERSLGHELAAALRENAPQLRFEDGDFVSLPVDPRECRRRACADSSERGRLSRSFEGEPPTAFVHTVDCRAARQPDDADCSGPSAGHLYLQYWLYYPDSHTRPFGRLGGYHLDDWESFQVRIGGDGEPEARASSHNGHQYGPDKLSDVDPGAPIAGAGRDGWGPSLGYLWVSAGSHAGRASDGDRYFRSVDSDQLRLVAIEPELAALDGIAYEVSPPWRKRVWRDPEYEGT